MSKGYVAKHEVGHKPEGNPTELYQRAGRKGSRTTHYVPASALRPERRTKVPGRAPMSKERAQAEKILAILAGMADAGPRRSAGIRSTVGKLYAYVARAERRPVDADGLRRWLTQHSHSFKDDVEETVIIACRETCSFLPPPREIGDATDYTNQEWDDDGCPAFVWPTDIRSDAEIARIQDAKRREKDRMRARERRERNGACPRNCSKVALAEFYKVHRKTIENWLHENRLDPETGDKLDPETGEVVIQFRPNPKRASYRKRTKVDSRPETAPADAAPTNIVPDGNEVLEHPAAFTEADLAALAAAVDAGLRSGTATEHPRRREALVRLLERAAQAFAPKQGSNDRGGCRAGRGPNERHHAAGAGAGGGGGKSEVSFVSAGQHPTDQEPDLPSKASLPREASTAAGINHQEDTETMTARADTTDTPVEPAPTGAPVRSRRDWGVAIWKVNRQLVEPDLDDAERIVLEDERAELIAGLRAAFPAPEQAQDGQGGSGPTDRPAGEHGRERATSAPRQTRCPNVGTPADRPTTYSAPSFRRARA